MPTPKSKTVIVAGASSGIGLACAKLLADKGFTVYGLCRREMPESQSGIRWLQADVTCRQSVAAAVHSVLEAEDAIDIVIQSAGMGVAGSVEDCSDEEIHMQFGPNFFGTVHLLRAVLPVMRRRRQGLFIQIGSIAGLLTIPYQGYYSASKYALEALIESLRMECRPFGIKACLVEPGDTHTGFTSARIFAETRTDAYENALRRAVGVMEQDERRGVPPEKVAAVILKLIKRRNPPVRVAVGLNYKLVLFAKRILPCKTTEWLMRRKYIGRMSCPP
jgi:NAD(P)-dependent dehydrogenase (short-subunit alcohol dehydrogenase family)